MLDKKFLYIVLAYAGFTAIMLLLFVLPLFNRWRDNTHQHNALVIEQMQQRTQLNAADTIRADHANAVELFNQAQARLFNESNLADVESILTAFVHDYDLTIYNIQLPTAAHTHSTWDAFCIMPVNMRVSGLYNDFLRMLDTINQTEYKHVTYIHFEMNNPDNESSLVPLTIHDAILYIELIMMQDLESQ